MKNSHIAKICSFLLILIAVLLWVALILHKIQSNIFLSTVTGLTFIIWGIIKIIVYLYGVNYTAAVRYNLALGTLIICLGLIVLISKDLNIFSISIALGIETLANAIIKIRVSKEIKHEMFKHRVALWLCVIVLLFISIVLIFNLFPDWMILSIFLSLIMQITANIMAVFLTSQI